MALKADLSALEKTYLRWESEGVSPFFPVVESNGDNTVTIEPHGELVMFGSCDYLGLSQHPALKAGAVEAIEQFGTNTYASQLICGHTRIHQTIEATLGKMSGGRAALMFPSGMSASAGAVSTLASSEDVVINDRLAHSSLFMGSRLSGAEVRTFPHNSMKRLETILGQCADKRRRIIVVDGLYSADGDYAPLDRITELAEAYDALVVVDEAHSFGSIGPNGLGVADHFGVLDRIDVIIGTMSKTLGSIGGFVLTHDWFERELRYMSPSYTSSRGSAPAVAGATLASLRLLEEQGNRLRAQLNSNTEFITERLRAAGFDLLNTRSHIVPVVVGPEDKTVAVAKWLMGRGVLVAPFVYPHVAAGTGRLRVGVSSRHTADECELLISALTEAKREFGF
ncbi:2-amino-3-ketobutyrate CoA ligase (plasmid) [Streptomyces clavuligerus]|nr:2-amino-3-ketobutyrate coenzyme A ligase [Streptomyces clavuligerus]MBY6307681.1 pyridoxal phosphate-dependent aminotransferase family protein [Streptomyces clavuligerus]QCS09772.1 2-amino-3-ketobutyrate CoA ligase [Streptomyces clavuligerus]QPJ98513.1 aminotransferase class I/II-fold pyridoxal phosphate-dependent enzyme [Streptomyces clavuligerus]